MNEKNKNLLTMVATSAVVALIVSVIFNGLSFTGGAVAGQFDNFQDAINEIQMMLENILEQLNSIIQELPKIGSWECTCEDLSQQDTPPFIQYPYQIDGATQGEAQASCNNFCLIFEKPANPVRPLGTTPSSVSAD